MGELLLGGNIIDQVDEGLQHSVPALGGSTRMVLRSCSFKFKASARFDSSLPCQAAVKSSADRRPMLTFVMSLAARLNSAAATEAFDNSVATTFLYSPQNLSHP